MTVIELAKEFLKQACIPENLIVKKAYGKSPEWTSLHLVTVLLSVTSAKNAAELLISSKDTVNGYTSKLLGNIVKQPKGQRTWAISILDYIKYKLCTKCNIYKPYDSFHSTTTKIVGVTTFCKVCNNNYSKTYYSTHVEESVAKNAQYRARKAQAIPIWANLEDIAKFYLLCPIGYHVDHIIPLHSELVCGLHVLNNLQYLSVEDNLRKGNKFEDMA